MSRAQLLERCHRPMRDRRRSALKTSSSRTSPRPAEVLTQFDRSTSPGLTSVAHGVPPTPDHLPSSYDVITGSSIQDARCELWYTRWWATSKRESSWLPVFRFRSQRGNELLVT
jgi:hypothetical protein